METHARGGTEKEREELDYKEYGRRGFKAREMKDFEWELMVLFIANGSESKGKCQLDEYSEDGVY